jgi:hypothetical protein
LKGNVQVLSTHGNHATNRLSSQRVHQRGTEIAAYQCHTAGVRALVARAQALNLGRHTVALRSFQRDEFKAGAEAPTEGHILAVNQLLTRLRLGLIKRARRMNRLVRSAIAGPGQPLLTVILTHKHLSHTWVQRIELIWDFYLELFGQRASRFGSWLLSADRIALDCYQVAYLGIGRAKSVPAPPPFCYIAPALGLLRTSEESG